LVLLYNPPRPGAGGDSQGMVDYMHEKLNLLMKNRPYCEIQTLKSFGPPKIIAHYNNGSIKNVTVSRWKKQEIEREINRVCDASGSIDQKKFTQPVLRGEESALNKLPSWDPFHAEKIFRP
jgi:hypothetical protein